MKPKIISAAIRVGSKVYQGKHHDEAIEKAKEDGKDVSKIDKEKDGLFQVSDGRLISREQAGKEFGITHSEELWPIEQKSLNFLVLDCGIFTSLSNALSMDGKNKVYYHTNWSGDAFPKLQDFAPGTGFDNLIKIKRLYTEIDFTAKDHPTVDETGDKIDCVICFDVGRNDEIDDIRRRYPNLSVVGSGVGEILEEDRVGLKKICKRLGLDVNDYVIKKGIDALAEYSKSNKDIYAKIDIFRQSMETIHIEDFETAEKEQTFEKLKVEFGPVFSKTVPFLVEKSIPSDVEGGFDGFAVRRNAIPLFGKTLSSRLKLKLLMNKPPVVNVLLDNDALLDSIKICEFLIKNEINTKMILLEEKDASLLGFKKTWEYINKSPLLTFDDLFKLKMNL